MLSTIFDNKSKRKNIMEDERKIKYEGVETISSIRDHLYALLSGLEEGRVVLKSKDEELTLVPQDDIKFSIKAKTGQKKSKLEIKMSWKRNKDSIPVAITSE